jgi:Uma2 family endonuclease
MSAQPQPRLTPEQYLEIERAAEIRSEFYGGRMYAMSGGTHTHALVIGNVSGELRAALKDGPCLVTPSDLRVRVAPDGLYTYPDIVVVCAEPRYVDGHRDTLLNPVLIVEVLSPSTEGYDRGFKAAQFRNIESLQEYALVSQSEPRVEVLRRQASGDWLLSDSVGLESVCRFESVGVSLPLSAIYSKVAFDLEGPSSRPSAGLA